MEFFNVSGSRLMLLLLMSSSLSALAGNASNKGQRQRDVEPFERPTQARANQYFMNALSLAENQSTLNQGVDALRTTVNLYRDLNLPDLQAIAELALADHLLYQGLSEETEAILVLIDEDRVPQDALTWSWAKYHLAKGELDQSLELIQLLGDNNKTNSRIRAEASLLSIHIKQTLGQPIDAEEWLEAQAITIRSKCQDLFHFYQGTVPTDLEQATSFMAWFVHIESAGWIAFPAVSSFHDVDLELPPPPVPYPNGSGGN